MAPPRLKLMIRRDDKLECLWALEPAQADALVGQSPVDLDALMSEAISRLTDDDMRVDAVFVANRPAWFWMDAQGMRDRPRGTPALVTVMDQYSVPWDVFKGVRVAISDNI